MAGPSPNTEYIANETAEQRSMKPATIFLFFVPVQNVAVIVGTAKPQGVDILPRTVQGSTLSSDNSANFVVIRIVNVDDVWSSLSHRFHFLCVEKALSFIVYMTTSHFYIQHS